MQGSLTCLHKPVALRAMIWCNLDGGEENILIWVCTILTEKTLQAIE